MKFLTSFLFVVLVLVCNVYCQRGQPQFEGTSCKSGVDTYEPSYDDCTLYYECVGAKWVSRRCSDSLFWNQREKKCSSPDTAQCVQA